MEITHECIRCEREFPTADALIRHVQRVHPAPQPTGNGDGRYYQPCPSQ